jgi:hypothetical protein
VFKLAQAKNPALHFYMDFVKNKHPLNEPEGRKKLFDLPKIGIVPEPQGID